MADTQETAHSVPQYTTEAPAFDTAAQEADDAAAHTGSDAATETGRDAAPGSGGDAGPDHGHDAAPEMEREEAADHGRGDEESETKPRWGRRRTAEGLNLWLETVSPILRGVVLSYDERLRQLESTVGGLSVRLQGISNDLQADRNSAQARHDQIVNALATEERSIRDFIKKEVALAVGTIKDTVKSEVAAEAASITDTIVRTVAEKDKERESWFSEVDARIKKDMEETYKVVIHHDSSIQALKDEVHKRSREILKQVKENEIEESKHHATAFLRMSELENVVARFESNTATTLHKGETELKSFVASQLDHNATVIAGLTSQTEREIAKQIDALFIRLTAEEPPEKASHQEYTSGQDGRRSSEARTAFEPAHVDSKGYARPSPWETTGELSDDKITAFAARVQSPSPGNDAQERLQHVLTGQRQLPPHMSSSATHVAARREATITGNAPVPAAVAPVIPQGYQLVPIPPAQAQPQRLIERVKFKDAKHFAGKDGEDIDLWLNEVTNELRFGGRTDEEIADGLPMLLEGEAKRWLNRLPIALRASVMHWEGPGGWKEILRANFGAANYEIQARQRLNQLKWEENIKFSKYFDKRSELQAVCCVGYSDAALIEDMMAGMSATDQADARKEVRTGMSLLQWKRAIIDREAAMRECHEMARQLKDMNARLAQLTKTAPAARRSTAWAGRFASCRSTDNAQPEATTASGSKSAPQIQQRSGPERQNTTRPAYNRPQTGADETYTRTARTQVTEIEEQDTADAEVDEGFVNEDFDDDAEADFVDCMMVQTRSARRAAGTSEAAVPDASGPDANGPGRAVVIAPSEGIPEAHETTYQNKSPAYLLARFSEDETAVTFKVCADTGSSITLMHRGIARRYFSGQAARPERLINVKGVGGQTSIAQSLTLNLRLKDASSVDISMPVKFFINPADDNRIILGNDFMEKYGAVIDISNQRLMLTKNVGLERRIQLTTRRENVPLLRVTEAFSLKPFHRARINARLSGRPSTEYFIIDPVPLQNGTVAVSAPRGIATTKKALQQLEVYNLEPWPYQFNAGVVIARAEDVKDHSGPVTHGEVFSAVTGSKDNVERDVKQFQEALKDLDINPALSQEQGVRIRAVLTKFRHAFAYGDRPLGKTNLTKVRIDTGDSAPVSTPPFRVSPEGRRFIEEEITKLLANDVIEEADSPWAANVVLIKQRQKIRFCVDYRKVNAVTRTDQYPLPRIDDYLNQFQGKRYLSTFDANSGFNQVEIEETDREKTAFRTHVGLYQYKRMLFGLKNGPSIFQRCMDKALGTAKWEFAVVYIDDIVVYSADFEDHIRHVTAVLSRIIPTGFTLSLAKSQICYQEIHALGHKVSPLGIGMKGENVKAILNFPRPANVRQIQVFLGMAGYYRRFIKNFASIARPLTKLLAKDITFVWSEECETAFRTLRDKLAEEPILAHPDYNKEFLVYTDASTLGVGAVLAQKDDEGKEHIVCAISKALEERERRLSATELECLALVWAMRQLRPYIDGVDSIQIITDHAALQWIYDYKGTNRKLQRWLLELQPWRDIARIVHRPGRTHSNVDALSRVPASQAGDVAEVMNVSAIQPDASILSKIREGYLTDQFFAGVLEKLQQCARRGTLPTGTVSTFELQNGVLFRRTSDGAGLAMCIPRHESLRSNILHDFHDAELAGHMGWEKTFTGLARLYYWPKLRRDVKAYVGSCDKCQKNKSATRPPAGLLQPLQVVTERWHTVTMDFAGPFVKSPNGNDTVMIVVDKCTKRVHFVATKQTANAKSTAQVFIANVVRLHGLPRILLSDRDKKFTSQFWTELMSKLGVKTAFSTANHPQTDGQSEAAVKILKTILRQYINYKQSNWEEILPLAEIAYNNSVNAVTGFTPFELDTGYVARMPHDVMNATDRTGLREVDDLIASIKDKTEEAAHTIREAQRRQAANHDAGRTEYNFKVDDLVLLSTKHITPPWAKKQRVKKLRPLWIGPYRVTDVINVNSYGLELPADMKIHSTINVEYLKPYVASPDEWASRLQYGLPIQEQEGIEYFEPEALLDREQRGAAARNWYLVKWKGRPIGEASWRPETELQAAVPRMVASFDHGSD